jgi:transposase-like protein
MRPLKAKIALEAVREQATVADLAHRYKVMSRSALQRLPDQPPHEKGQRDRA